LYLQYFEAQYLSFFFQIMAKLQQVENSCKSKKIHFSAHGQVDVVLPRFVCSIVSRFVSKIEKKYERFLSKFSVEI